jgi:hypothetical protein
MTLDIESTLQFYNDGHSFDTSRFATYFTKDKVFKAANEPEINGLEALQQVSIPIELQSDTFNSSHSTSQPHSRSLSVRTINTCEWVRQINHELRSVMTDMNRHGKRCNVHIQLFRSRFCV